MTTIPIDKAGRIVIPKEMRASLNLVAGDLLEAEFGPNTILLRPRHISTAHLARIGGRVFWDAPGASATIEEIEEATGRGQNERDRRASGIA